MSYYRPFDSRQPAPLWFKAVPGTLIDPAEVREAKRRVMLKRALRRNRFFPPNDLPTPHLINMVREIVRLKSR